MTTTQRTKKLNYIKQLMVDGKVEDAARHAVANGFMDLSDNDTPENGAANVTKVIQDYNAQYAALLQRQAQERFERTPEGQVVKAQREARLVREQLERERDDRLAKEMLETRTPTGWPREATLEITGYPRNGHMIRAKLIDPDGRPVLLWKAKANWPIGCRTKATISEDRREDPIYAPVFGE